MSVPQICLKCEKTLLNGTQRMECQACGVHWPVDHGIPSYDSAKYFGEVSQEKMQELIALAEKGHWLTAVRSMFKESNPEQYDYVADLNRASWIPVLPIGPQSTVLDVGSGMGVLTHALALNYERVVSVEPVAERVRFTKIRLDQEGLKNVDLIHTTLDVLPFYAGTFDLIILNGILEWVGEWRSSGTPREAQIDVLKDLRRLLKPNGVLLIGIENRIGYESFLGRMDHPGVRFTSLMPRWLASLYLKLKKPGFYRTLIDPTKGYRTYTYSLRGYRKLLRLSGFPVVEGWWPPRGYNAPHVMYHVSNRAEIKAYCIHECRYTDRVHGYAFRRLLKQWGLVYTGLIHMMFPDVVMFAKPVAYQRGEESHGNGSLVTAILKILSAQHGSVGAADISDYAGSLVTHGYKNKTIVKMLSSAGGVQAVVKIANVILPGAGIVDRSFRKLQRVYSALEHEGQGLHGFVPFPIETVQVGPLIATMEQPVKGNRLVDLVMEPKYFRDRNRVRCHLELIASWLIASKPKLDTLGVDSLFDAIPSEWFVAPDGDNAASHPSASDSVSLVQHGDFFPENVFVNEASTQICVIDWDSCGTGYPPLFDWFCLVTGLWYTHERIRDLPKGQTVDFISFRQTYFEPSWFSEFILTLSHRLCDRFGLDRARLIDYFWMYVVVRYQQFVSQFELDEKHYWGPPNSKLYEQYYEFLLSNHRQCCFWSASASKLLIGRHRQ